MSTCTKMVAWEGRPDDAMECDAPAFPTSDPPRCVTHILGEVVHQVEAYQVGVDAARKMWANRNWDETLESLLAEANEVLAVLERTGQQAIRTRGYRDTLAAMRTAEVAG